jgi:hypothetical protein
MLGHESDPSGVRRVGRLSEHVTGLLTNRLGWLLINVVEELLELSRSDRQ